MKTDRQLFADQILNNLQLKKASYADVRLEELTSKNIATKDGIIEAYSLSSSLGFGVRVLVNGSWGFAASFLEDDFSLNSKSKKLIEKICKKAYDLAYASSLFNKTKTKLYPLKPIKDTYISEAVIDPFTVKDDKIISLLLQADKNLRVNKKIKISQAFFGTHKLEKTFASTQGALINQTIVFTGAGTEATAVDKGEVQNRSYPNSFRGQFRTQGWEMVEKLDLLNHAPLVGEEACKLIEAENCPEGEFDLIIDGNQLALQVHESIGHAVEFDRILGLEASFAGTSFLDLKDLNTLKYGSDKVNITADATLKGGLGSFAYDDEGVPAKRQEIITNGLLKGFLTSRQTAAEHNLEPTGAMRAESWQNIPLIRMTNINLEPGNWNLNDLIKDTKKGLFLSTNRSWSIDDKRVNFQFGTEMAREIKNGKLGKYYKNPVYSGTTVNFWQSCDAVCNASHWQIWGTPNCGKGEPVQTMHVGHGTAPARFLKVKVFAGK